MKKALVILYKTLNGLQFFSFTDGKFKFCSQFCKLNKESNNIRKLCITKRKQMLPIFKTALKRETQAHDKIKEEFGNGKRGWNKKFCER